MSSILDAARNAAKTANPALGRPPAAVELTPEGALAAAMPGQAQAPVYAYVPLPEGAVVPGIEGANLRQPEIVTAAIGKALDQTSPGKRAVTLILPDMLVRVFVLDFDAFPAKAAEAVPVLRFRLRKMVPFDVEHAGVSYQVLSQDKDQCRVLTAVVPGPILAEYEEAVRKAGYEPGAVLPSSLAALEAIDVMEAVLTANLSARTLTTTIINGQNLLLYRTLDLPEDPAERIAEIQRSVAVAAAYYEDKLQARPRQLYYAGNWSLEEFAQWFGDPDLAIVELAPRPESGVLTPLGAANTAAVAGALAFPTAARAVAR